MVFLFLFSHQPPVLPWMSVPPWCATTTRRQWAGNTVPVQFPTKWWRTAETVMSNNASQTTQVATYPTCTAPRPTWSLSPPSLIAARASTATHTLTLQVRLSWNNAPLQTLVWILSLINYPILLYKSHCNVNHPVFLLCLSGPCPPTNVHVSLQCVGNVGHVTWNAAPQADLYVATAIASAVDEHDHTCTSNGTSCSLTDLHCGETAVVTLVTIERGCMSEPSLPFTFQSG